MDQTSAIGKCFDPFCLCFSCFFCHKYFLSPSFFRIVQLPEPPSTGLKSGWWARTVRGILAFYCNNTQTTPKLYDHTRSIILILIVRVSSPFSSSSQFYPRISCSLSGNTGSSRFLPVHFLGVYHASGSALPHTSTFIGFCLHTLSHFPRRKKGNTYS